MNKVTQQEFKEFLQKHQSDFIKEMLKKYDPLEINDPDWSEDTDFYIHEGDIEASGKWNTPGQITFVAGNIIIHGFLDTDEEPKIFDEGGWLIIGGNVECEFFANTYGKAVLVDGNLSVKQLLVNHFEDSALIVKKDLTTKFFYGVDIWAEVGGTARMEFGYGHCFPLGDKEDQSAIEPKHDSETSLAILNVDDPHNINELNLLQLIKSGKSVFK